MAARTSMQLVPSTGVLIGAVLAAVVAAVLVNLYIAGVKSQYTAGAVSIFVLKEPVKEGQPLLPKQFRAVTVPAAFRDAFEKALKPGDEQMLSGKTAPRNMGEGQPIFYGDLYAEAITELPVIVGRGYDLVTIPIQSDSAGGLQPGGYVRIFGVFDDDPDPRKEQPATVEVLRNVQVRLVDGSAKPIPADKRARYDNISILVTEDQAKKLLQIEQVMLQKQFIITGTRRPEQMEDLEPEINREVLKYIEPERLTAPAPPLS